MLLVAPGDGCSAVGGMESPLGDCVTPTARIWVLW